MTLYYVDFAGGNDGNNGQSFANRKKTLASLTGATGGDTIRLMESPAASSLGQTASWTNQSPTVSLSSALTQNVYLDGAWTAMANITCATDTARKQGTNSSTVTIGAAFTTGLAAYYATGALNLSTYQQLSFWFMHVTGTATPNAYKISLCSDTAGATPVDEFTIPYTLQTGVWHVITINKGANLGSSIQSVALYVLTDLGSVSVRIDNIIACKAASASDCLTLNHVIGKNDGDWWAIRAINGTTIELETGGADSNQGTGRGYSGTTESVTTYARLPIKPADTVAANFSLQTYAGSDGSSGTPVTISGGWNSTDMSTQTGDTYLDALSVNSFAFFCSSKAYLNISKIGIVRGQGLFDGLAGGDYVVSNVAVINTSNNTGGGGFYRYSGLSRITLDQVRAQGCAVFHTGGVNGRCSFTNINIKSSTNNESFSGSSTDGMIINNITCLNSGTLTIEGPIAGKAHTITCNYSASQAFIPPAEAYNVSCANNSGAALNLTNHDVRIFGLTTSGNANTVILNASRLRCTVYDGNCSETTKRSSASIPGSVLTFHRSTGYANNITYCRFGQIEMQGSVVPSGLVYAWKFSPTNVSCVNADEPLGWEFPIAVMACAANVSNSFQFACRRSSTNLTCTLRVHGGRYPGIGSVSTDITTNVNPSVDTWTNYTISVTPTEACVIEIFFECYHNGTTTYVAYVGGPVVQT